MGLLSKAAASVAPGKGLLVRSLELLGEQTPEDRPLLITQPEVDSLFRNRTASRPVLRKTRKLTPSEIPLTWAAAGIHAPVGLSPLIDTTEYQKAFKAEHRAQGGKPSAHPPKVEHPGSGQDPTEGIISAIFALPQGVELPARIFSLLTDRLSISKGALLLLDPARSVYAPWASIGFDPTTLHRLRIPPEMGESIGSAANGRPVVAMDRAARTGGASSDGAQDLSRWESFFSSRELALITRLILVPFLAGEKLLALLLIASCKPPFPSDDGLLTCLERIAGASAPAVQKAREERLSGYAAEPSAGTLEESITDLLSSKPGTRMLFFSLRLEGYRNRVLEGIPHLDSFRLEEDIRLFLHRFALDLGRALPLGGSTYLFAIQGMEKRDLDLFLHQLKSHLGILFEEPDGALSPSAVQKLRYYPAEGDSVPGLVSFFST